MVSDENIDKPSTTPSQISCTYYYYFHTLLITVKMPHTPQKNSFLTATIFIWDLKFLHAVHLFMPPPDNFCLSSFWFLCFVANLSRVYSFIWMCLIKKHTYVFRNLVRIQVILKDLVGWWLYHKISIAENLVRNPCIAQKMKFSFKNLFSKCDRICPNILKKSLTENYFLWSVDGRYFHLSITIFQVESQLQFIYYSHWYRYWYYFTIRLLDTQSIHFCLLVACSVYSLLISWSPYSFSKCRSDHTLISSSHTECFIFDCTNITC